MREETSTPGRFRDLEDVIRRAEALRWARARIVAAQLDLEDAIRRAHGAGAATEELAEASTMRRRHVRRIVERRSLDAGAPPLDRRSE
jgi:regulator of protease activity HflC (stomatin/prohibitin superfamily)